MTRQNNRHFYDSIHRTVSSTYGEYYRFLEGEYYGLRRAEEVARALLATDKISKVYLTGSLALTGKGKSIDLVVEPIFDSQAKMQRYIQRIIDNAAREGRPDFKKAHRNLAAVSIIESELTFPQIKELRGKLNAMMRGMPDLLLKFLEQISSPEFFSEITELRMALNLFLFPPGWQNNLELEQIFDDDETGLLYTMKRDAKIYNREIGWFEKLPW
jgi:hypothetical protein